MQYWLGEERDLRDELKRINVILTRLRGRKAKRIIVIVVLLIIIIMTIIIRSNAKVRLKQILVRALSLGVLSETIRVS